MPTIKCPRCERKLNYPDELAGKHGKCSNCGERVHLSSAATPIAPQPTEPPAAPPNTSASTSRIAGAIKGGAKVTLQILAANFYVLCILYYAATFDPEATFIMHFGAGVIVLAVPVFYLTTRRPDRRRMIVAVGAAVTLLLLGTDFYFSKYQDEWTTQSGDRVVDTMLRRNRTIVYRKYTCKESATESSLPYRYFMEGPIAGQDEQWHGRWKHYDDRDFRVLIVWYWYGEKVTEGKFHELAGK